MYKLELSKNTMKDLYLLREYAAQGSIIGQVRRSINQYIEKEIQKMGCSLEELQEIVERHERIKRKPSRKEELS
jgi:hypothetical protein